MINLAWAKMAKFLAEPKRADAIIQRSLRTPYSHLPSDNNPTYMARFWLFNPYDRTTNKPKYWWCPWSIRVHHIKREDFERHMHDHPWNARTIILKGWYVERRLPQKGDRALVAALSKLPEGLRHLPVEAVEVVTRKVGSTARLRFGQYHSISEVSPGGVWTLFISGPYRGTWGFLVDGLKKPWREYLDPDGLPKNPPKES